MSAILSRNRPLAGLVLLTMGVIGLDKVGFLVNSPALTATISAMLLVFGLPHGSFDLAILRRAEPSAPQNWSRIGLVLLYLSFAAAMYLVWRSSPVLALASFLVLATVHFAEDWDNCGSGFIAAGLAAAIVTAPALLHGAELRSLFVLLTGDSTAAVLADLMLLVAPTAGAVALVGLGMLWQTGRRRTAVLAGCALAATLLLPPVPGFALFFCLVHSPMQFRRHAESLALRGFGQWGRIVMPVSLGGLGIAAAVLVLNNNASLDTGVFAGSFMTLSILTVPHMLVPIVAGLWAPGRQPALG